MMLLDAPVLKTERLILRAPQASDWEAFRAFLADDRSRFIRREELDDAKAWRAFCHLIGTWVARGYGSFIITQPGDDTALGLTGPWHPIEWPEPELGWTLWSPQAEGRGIAFEAAAAVRDHIFADLGWKTLVSYIDPDNARSIALAKRLGAVLDPDAPTPPSDKPCLTFRHPTPPSPSRIA
jgi:RimJ/RimL family protein N-acetyltransferase